MDAAKENIIAVSHKLNKKEQKVILFFICVILHLQVSCIEKRDFMLVRLGYVAMSVHLNNASPSQTMTYTQFQRIKDREAAIL